MTQPQYPEIDGIVKIAILFRVLGSEFAKPLSEGMRPDEITRIGEAMVRFEQSPPSQEMINEVLREYRKMLSGGGGIANVNETLTHLFNHKFGEGLGPDVLEEVRLSARVDSSFEGMEAIPHADVARLLSEEHIGVQAAVLANIPPEVAAGVLDCLNEETQHDLLGRIATMKAPPPRLLRDMANMFMKRVRELPRAVDQSADGGNPNVRRAADILNSTDPEPKQSILERMEQDSPDLATELRETMFTFADLAKVEKKAMQQILGGIDTRLLALSLKSCPQDISDAIFSSVSKRTQDMIVEERELIGAVPITEVREAQDEIMVTIRGLMESGSITIATGGGGVEMVE